MKITEYTHTFTVSEIPRAMVALMNRFALNYAVVSIRRDPYTSEIIRKVEAMYAAAFRNRTQYHFHAHTLTPFKEFCQQNAIKYTHEIKPLYEPQVFDFTLKGSVRDYQQGQIDYALADGRTKLIGLQTGKGKALAETAQIKIPNGWVTLADLKVDAPIITADGSVSHVTAIYRQGKLPLYDVVFRDGRTSRCCFEHIWNCYEENNTSSDNLNQLTTREIWDRLASGRRLFIDTVIPETGTYNPQFTEESQQLQLLIKELHPQSGDVQHRLTVEEKIGEYFVEFSHASIAQRQSLLTQLLASLSIEWGNYRCLSEVVAKGIQSIGRSLGDQVTVYEPSGDTHYRIKYISRATSPKLEIINIIPRSDEDAICISIDHPDQLFVTNDYIVTHNTFCALQVIGQLKHRAAISLRGGFVHRWIPEISAILGLKPREMYTIRGAKDMINLIDEAKRGELKVKLLIFTSSTLDMFYDHYTTTNGDVERYGCNPLELWELLKVGLVIRDEVHLEFHKNFRQDLFSHIPKVLSLSATLISSDSTLSRMYTLMYPPDQRAPVIEYDKYIAASALTYGLKNPNRVKTTQRGRRDYSHTAYEDWIMSDKNRLLTYESIVIKWILDHYIKHAVNGQKAVVFCATIKLCTHLQKALQAKFPDKRVRRYVGDDPPEHLTNVDIIVTTILSAGTAQDIDGLRYTLMTVNINSMQSNVQTLGRLRRLKDWPDVTPEFYYLICLDIPKHVEYMREKHNTFEGLVLSHGCSDLGVYL